MLRELASDGAYLTEKTRTILGEIIQVVDNILKEGYQEGVLRETKSFLPYFRIVGSINIYTSTQKMRKKYTAVVKQRGNNGSNGTVSPHG